jgi:hypothetical protein
MKFSSWAHDGARLCEIAVASCKFVYFIIQHDSHSLRLMYLEFGLTMPYRFVYSVSYPHAGNR